jgi:branched-subunit amino acid transport protein
MPAISGAVFLTLLYSVPLWPIRQLAFTRKTGFLKTVLLAFTWTYVTVMIPVQQAVDLSNYSVALLFTARFLFMLMLCIIFDSRDISVDKINSLRSLATDVSKKTLQFIMATVFTVYLCAGVLLRNHFHDTAQVIAFLITGLLTVIVYRLSLKKQGYFFYYFVVDGMMLFSAAATFVASI